MVIYMRILDIVYNFVAIVYLTVNIIIITLICMTLEEFNIVSFLIFIFVDALFGLFTILLKNHSKRVVRKIYFKKSRMVLVTKKREFICDSKICERIIISPTRIVLILKDGKFYIYTKLYNIDKKIINNCLSYFDDANIVHRW